MNRKLLFSKAGAAAFGAAGLIFNRGNADIGSFAILIAGILILALDILLHRGRYFLAGVNFVGILLAGTFATVMIALPNAYDRFYMLAVIFAFIQLLVTTSINLRAGWFKRTNLDNVIDWVLHLVVWCVFVFVGPDSIGGIGLVGTYLAILAVHWGIVAAGPAPLKQD